VDPCVDAADDVSRALEADLAQLRRGEDGGEALPTDEHDVGIQRDLLVARRAVWVESPGKHRERMV
jgi:hypothetical protein